MRLTSRQRHWLWFVARYETYGSGVAVPKATGDALVEKGYCRSVGGGKLRLTNKGKEWRDA